MTVRIGVIGTGNIGSDHIRRLTRVCTGAQVTAVTDIDPARAAEVGSEYGARALATGAEVIRDAEVDAVLVASWGPTHADYVLEAIAEGKPVFCEKPLATTAEDCLRIVDAELAHGSRLVQVGFMRRYDAGYRALKQAVDAGRIGTPLIAHCAHRNPSVPESYTSEMAVQDTAVHEIDVMRWLLDDEIISVQVLTPRRTGRAFEHLQDPQIVLFETANGVRIDLEVFVNCRFGYDIRCQVVGEDGAASLPQPAQVPLLVEGREQQDVLQDWRDRFVQAYDREIQEWVDSVAAKTVGGPSAWDGYAATVITDAGVEALASGAIVPVSIKDRPAFYGADL
ncbi:Gfo/Idh/MocA family oxidoreductase [Streptacidiphilus carbonis]|jgi:myo-inositol 2-dehydrogenase / D-chiro-inositol 1-dehydrogenase|uniref:Gfo/Idh/MocA family oxidoreductase n=1 Tax=Streptacidiphilus carbonis TaxID=105422 RepID=UPI0005A67CC9|nr:Gfo/Idh/MocA family oxidoreductase [Streptacidiphilus carbonis]